MAASAASTRAGSRVGVGRGSGGLSQRRRGRGGGGRGGVWRPGCLALAGLEVAHVGAPGAGGGDVVRLAQGGQLLLARLPPRRPSVAVGPERWCRDGRPSESAGRGGAGIQGQRERSPLPMSTRGLLALSRRRSRAASCVPRLGLHAETPPGPARRNIGVARGKGAESPSRLGERGGRSQAPARDDVRAGAGAAGGGGGNLDVAAGEDRLELRATAGGAASGAAAAAAAVRAGRNSGARCLTALRRVGHPRDPRFQRPQCG